MPLDEKAREEKEAYAQKIMAEMKLKNEKFKERHREVQRDRERAEERNSSITTGRFPKKEADSDIPPKAKQEREWDRGKPDPDSCDWDSSAHHEYYPRNARRYSDRRLRKEDDWRSRSTNASSKPTSSFFSKYHSNKYENVTESSMYRSDTNRFNSRSRSQVQSSYPVRGHSTTESNHQSYHNKKKYDQSKKLSEEKFSSRNYNNSKKESVGRSVDHDAGMNELMWQCGSMNELQHKLSRIENWVKSININHEFTDTNDAISEKEDHKSQVKKHKDFSSHRERSKKDTININHEFPDTNDAISEKEDHKSQVKKHKDFSSHRERSKKYGPVEDSSSKKSKEQSRFRIKEKSEHKINTYFSNTGGHANRMSTGDRCSSVSDCKKERDVKRKKVSDRSRRNCDSDISDEASSMKESDDLDWGRDKIIRATSNSKSSETSFSQGREKRVYRSEEQSDSCSFKNLKSSKITRLETDSWNEEKHEEIVKQTTLRQNFFEDNGKHQYGTKSLSLHDSSENYGHKSHSYKSRNGKKPKNCLKNKKFLKYKSDSGLISSSGDLNDENKFNSPKFTYDQIDCKNIDSKLKKKDNDLKKLSVDYKTESKSKGFSGVRKKDCVEFNFHNSKRNVSKVNSDSETASQILNSVYENSFLNDDVNCGDIYKKNVENAENIITLQNKQSDYQTSKKRRVSVKRYVRKKTSSKIVKLPPKSKYFNHSKKVTDQSLREDVDYKNHSQVSHLDSEYSDYDKPINVPDSPNSVEHPVYSVRNLPDGNRVQNLSDGEWSTITDEDDENNGVDLTD